MPSVNDIRSTFLSYFEKNGHTVVPSSPLVPRNDPTLMFTNSGMVQFKNCFTGLERRDYVRATSAQKCVRAGGKHNDLDNVGYTARHHTFFEMLGNFSFGDYFKSEAIPFAWELITGDFGIPKDRLYTTVFHTDDEAFEIWKKVGVPEDRIIRIATSDNFWQMGDTGPCGPCTEIFYDHGDHIWGGPPGSPEEDGDRFIEIWNIVFMQNERFADGSMTELEMQSIDTGMGLERISALLQGTHDNYETDLFKSLIEASAQATGVDPYGEKNVHHRVIADHLRSTSFLIADGVMPSNEGRGYVLRRIMRRAMRHAHLLGAQDPVMYRLVPELVRQMGEAYPELRRGQALIEETLKLEETRFKQTLERGLKLLDEELEGLDAGSKLPGASAFKLYDTYGFPLDLTQDALREKGREVDTAGFDAAMAEQKAKARAAWSGSGETADATIWYDIAEEKGATEFLGYDTEKAEGEIVALVRDGARVESVKEGETVQIVVNQTPFYAEAGGQVGDAGVIRVEKSIAKVTDTKKVAGVFIHFAEVLEGSLRVGNPAVLEVDHTRRTDIRANHSATHLLHEALRETLGDHVAQRGSLNAPDRLRFDFSHTKALTPEEIAKVERDVNDFIRQNTAVETRIMTPDDARALGAQALFGEKYGDEVRVVSMGRANTGKGVDGKTYSIELCGGTHVTRTGDIGLCVLLGDSASSAGVRRIEALTGRAALAHLAGEAQRATEVATVLKTPVSEVVDRVKSLAEERRKLEQEVAALRQQIAMGGGAGSGPEAKEVGGVTFLAQALRGVSGKDLRALIDAHKTRLGSGVILLIAEEEGKVAVAAGVTDDLTGRISAVDVLKAAVPAVGGKGGGGRPDMAQGGGKDFSGAEAAIAAAEKVLEE
ncbi:alanine--tRNA ligase [Celeribacter indicus]|uniref:Alanine--tRNA ligase n=1 Tax=Celeribacter indicus TaxID=1208324 RepID=A0A0B5E0H0_9RHOB|nr:alanine--tRNA ligase [Celeribacter indicus]AJE46915.1 alanyl-tRNA ligase [Celeribacter indicus]SDW78735.1 alanyl-tRNA synthetase [Celeribacter indicus]